MMMLAFNDGDQTGDCFIFDDVVDELGDGDSDVMFAHLRMTGKYFCQIKDVTFFFFFFPGHPSRDII